MNKSLKNYFTKISGHGYKKRRKGQALEKPDKSSTLIENHYNIAQGEFKIRHMS